MRRFALLFLALLPGLVSAQVLTRVVVADADGGGFLEGVTIQLQPVDSANPVAEAVTTSANGSAGTATFEDVAPGTYYAFAAPTSGYATPSALRVEAGQFVSLLELRRLDSEAGRIEGTVTDAESGAALRFARLAFVPDPVSGDTLLFATTDADGRYALPVAPGLFEAEVVVRDPGPDGQQAGYAPLAVSVTVPQGTATLDLAFVPNTQGTISGTVTDAETGQPLANATVSATSTAGDSETVDVRSDGTYTLSVPVGTYIVRAQTPFQAYAPEFYDNAATEADATPLAVGDGDVLSGIDLSLSPAPEAFSVTVEGTVRDESGDPARGVYATLFSASGGVIAQDSTRADGTYRLVSADPRGSDSEVRVCFRSPLYLFECYDDAATLQEATPLATGTEPVVFTGIDAEVSGLAQGTVTGRVTDEATGEGLGQVLVRSTPLNGGLTTVTTTNADGDFGFDTLVGDYVINALPPEPYVSEFYDDARTLAAATPVTVTDGGTASGVDFALARAADGFSVTIEGTVTNADGDPVRGAIVSVLDPEQFIVGTAVGTGADGQYRFTSNDTRLAGTRLAVFAADSTQNAFRVQYYDGQPTLELADRLVIGTEAATFSGIDFVLAAPDEDLDGFAVSGTVRSEMTGGPLGGATVLAVRTDAPGLRAVTTSASGAYRLDGLAPGTYTVLFTAGDHAPEFYPDATSWQEGELLTVSGDVFGVNALIGGLNRPVGAGSRSAAPFVTDPALLGAVRDASGPLRGALVVARDPAGAATAFALTDGSGEFAIAALPSESTTLQVDLARYAVEHRPLTPGTSVHLVSLTSQASTSAETTPEADGLALSVAPNPVRGRATVAYALAASGEVRVSVYDVLGREVAVIASGLRAGGTHEAALDTAALAPGLYVVRAESASSVQSARFTVVR